MTNLTLPTVSQRILDEGAVGLGEAVRLFTLRAGKPVHTATMTRWCKKGILRPDGTRVRLEHVRIGNRLFTSRPACLRFIEAQQFQDASADAPSRSPHQRQRASDVAAAELAALGVN